MIYYISGFDPFVDGIVLFAPGMEPYLLMNKILTSKDLPKAQIEIFGVKVDCNDAGDEE